MINISISKCQDYQEFSQKLQGINKDIEYGNLTKEEFCKISEFIENNKDLFIGNQRAAILLDSMGSKLRLVNANDLLINTLQKHIEQLLPTNPGQIKVSLQFFRRAITDASQRFQSIANWISVMKIPLANLDLSEEELAGVLVRLEDIDLNNYNFESHDLKLFTKIILKPDLKFKTRDTVVLGTIARLCVQQDARSMAKYIKNFEIDDPALRFDLAYLCAKNFGGVAIMEHFKNFQIMEQSDRCKIACLCVEEGTGLEVWAMIQFIKNFEINDASLRAEMALVCAKKDGLFTSAFIKSFEIANSDTLIQIAHLCAHSGVARFIKNFEIADLAIRLQIARICAQKDGGRTAEWIKNFEIVDKSDLVEIARLCAKNEGDETAKFIKNFEIEDPNIRFQIALLCAKNNSGTAKSIKNFEIVDQSQLCEIACLCAQSKGDTASFINDFQMTSPLALEKIARLCAMQDCHSTALHFKNFKINNQAIRAEIALLCVKGHGAWGAFNTACYIKNFEIDDPRLRTEIARFCAQNGGSGTAKFIKNFEIVDESIRSEIACLCAKQSPSGTADYFKNFEIGDSKVRAEIARLCAMNDGEYTACNIKNFEIVDAAVRFDIARICAKQSGRGTAKYFRNFDILNSAEKIEIARLCAKQNGSGMAEWFENFDLSNNQEMFFLCAISDPQSLFFIEKFLPLPLEVTEFSRLIRVLKSKEAEVSLRGKLFDEIDLLILKLSLSKDCQQTLMETSKKFRAFSPHSQNVVGLWFLSSLLKMRSFKRGALEWMITSGIWGELAHLHDPALRILLTPGLFELGADEGNRELWSVFLASVRGIMVGQKGLMLAAIPFFALQKGGLNKEHLIKIASYLSERQKDNTSQLRNVNYIKNLLYTLQALVSHNVYTVEMNKAAIEKIFSSFNEKNIIKNIVAAKGLLQLKDQEWPTSSEDLSVLFKKYLENVIPIQNCKENVSEKYDEIFGSCRNPGGLLTYAAGLKELCEPEVMNCLGRFVVSVLDKTFKEKRYETQSNPHLVKIVEFNPSLLQMWKEDLSFEFEGLTSPRSPSIVFNPEEWLEMKLIRDKRLGDTKLMFVNRFLDKKSDKNEVFQELLNEQSNLLNKDKEKKQLGKDIEKLKKKLKSLVGDNLKVVEQEIAKKKQTYNDINDQISLTLAQVNFEKACLNFIQRGEGTNKAILIGFLGEVDKALKKQETFARSEFTIDVKELIEGFQKELNSKGSAKKGLKIVFTDHPIDILLCGSEVGSCQRLDGDEDLNKGLLGYLVDGKNRLLAIKEGDKIGARCILSLLWDGTQPVIYRERFYPNAIPAHYKTALNASAKKVAEKLNVPLTSNDPGASYGKNLEALGGPSPYEYSDGGGGVKKDGLYTIKDAKLIF